MQMRAPLTLLEEIRPIFRTISLWIVNIAQVFGPIDSSCSSQFTIIPDKIYRWLSAIIPSENYNGALKVRLEDTGLWFINGTRFTQWKAEADDFLWICGTRMFPTI
jgi:hypothetical protein